MFGSLLSAFFASTAGCTPHLLTPKHSSIRRCTNPFLATKFAYLSPPSSYLCLSVCLAVATLLPLMVVHWFSVLRIACPLPTFLFSLKGALKTKVKFNPINCLVPITVIPVSSQTSKKWWRYRRNRMQQW